MDLRQLRYFIGVVDAGSMALASRRLHVSQPTLSRQIRDLEKSSPYGFSTVSVASSTSRWRVASLSRAAAI